MNINLGNRFTFVCAGIATIATIAKIVSNADNLPNYLYFPVVLSCFALAVISLIPEKPADWRLWKLCINGYIPLHKAAKIAYEKNQHTIAGKFAETAFSSNPADPIGFFSHALLGSTEDKSIQLFGCKPRLDSLNQISYQEYKRHNLVVDDKGAKLIDSFKEDMIIYDRLHIKKSDMKKQINTILTWDMSGE